MRGAPEHSRASLPHASPAAAHQADDPRTPGDAPMAQVPQSHLGHGVRGCGGPTPRSKSTWQSHPPNTENPRAVKDELQEMEQKARPRSHVLTPTRAGCRRTGLAPCTAGPGKASLHEAALGLPRSKAACSLWAGPGPVKLPEKPLSGGRPPPGDAHSLLSPHQAVSKEYSAPPGLVERVWDPAMGQ